MGLLPLVVLNSPAGCIGVGLKVLGSPCHCEEHSDVAISSLASLQLVPMGDEEWAC